MFAGRPGRGGSAAVPPAASSTRCGWAPANAARGAVLDGLRGALGVALGGLVIAYLIAVLGSWRSAFFIAGIATLAMAWLAWHYLRDDPAEHPGVNAASWTGSTPTAPPRSPKRTARPAEDWHRRPLPGRYRPRPRQLGHGVLRPADLGSWLPGAGARLRYQGYRRRDLRHSLRRRRFGRRASSSATC
ncbi:MFS transporter [Pseudomonas aeruginosa]|nr:MFS transporter [Pseudomonas aeruginosa]